MSELLQLTALSSAHLGWVACAAFGLGVALATHGLRSQPRPALPDRGHRGRSRRAARSASPLFATLEPHLQRLAQLLRPLIPASLLDALQDRLHRAGEPAGLTAPELVAASLLATLAGLLIAMALGLPMPLCLLAALSAACLPQTRVGGMAHERQARISRALPEAIDQAAMCMRAGLDFPGALRAVLQHRSGQPVDPLDQELARLLEALELGHTRAAALSALAIRVPSEPVRELVAAITQSEDKGTPLGRVLQVQARMSRMRRSVVAEERAARAAVWLSLPLLLLLCAVMLIMFGPFLVDGGGL